LTLDGKKQKSSIEGIEVETSSKWDDGKLRVERKFKGDVKVVDDYSVSVDPRLLTIVSKVQGGPMRGRERTIRRVYDPAPAR
jgi:hypothetical protein